MGDSQCQTGAWLTATSTAASPPAISTAPSQSTRPADPDRRLGHEELDRDGGDDGRDQRQPEQVVVGEVVDDRPGEDDAGAAADAGKRRHHPDGSRDALARELVSNDPEREREDAAGGALPDSAEEHHGKRGGKGADHRRDGRAG